MTTVQATHEKAGSVGAVWPPRYDAHNNRIKGFCTWPIENRRDTVSMFSTMNAAEKANPQATRTTVRAFVREGLMEGIRSGGMPYQVDASFDAGNAIGGHELVYFGRNTEQRMPSANVLERELSSVKEVAGIDRADYLQAATRIAQKGYSLSRLNGNGHLEVGRLLDLYREAFQEYTFRITPRAIGDMLNNGNIVIVGRDCEAEVVSSLIAEHVELRLEHGKTVHLYELSDYATFRTHRGNGLITLMQMEVIDAIRTLPRGDEAIIYAEDRAAWMAVNKSSQKAGMSYCGTLLQHCVIVSDRDFGEEGRYENLNVWAQLPG